MNTLRKDIEYIPQELPDGSRLKIQTHNVEALAAIHKFLKFQIEEHHTGDPTEPHT